MSCLPDDIGENGVRVTKYRNKSMPNESKTVEQETFTDLIAHQKGTPNVRTTLYAGRAPYRRIKLL